MEHFDVVIVGAGLSGIGAAFHLQERCPGKSYAILEGRDAIGGTWDLFRYPGIRSDSDMHTLGYSFKPWLEAKAIADGPSIRKYVNETADENEIRDNIRFNHLVQDAAWSTEHATWTVTSFNKATNETVHIAATSSTCAAATTTMMRLTRRNLRALKISAEQLCTRSSGLKTWITQVRKLL